MKRFAQLGTFACVLGAIFAACSSGSSNNPSGGTAGSGVTGPTGAGGAHPTTGAGGKLDNLGGNFTINVAAGPSGSGSGSGTARPLRASMRTMSPTVPKSRDRVARCPA